MLEYRSADYEDAPAIAKLHAESWRRAYRGNFRDEFLDSDIFAERLAVWKERLTGSDAKQFVCAAGDHSTIIGFICVCGAHDPFWGSFIDNLHVGMAGQGRGIGRRLMREARAWLSSRYPALGVHLFVWESNPAKSFYEHLGARDAEVLALENPGGGSGQYRRYVWSRPADISA